jgi:hypothetical protein
MKPILHGDGISADKQGSPLLFSGLSCRCSTRRKRLARTAECSVKPYGFLKWGKLTRYLCVCPSQ